MSNIDKRPFRADGGDISTGRLKEIADNPYGDEEKCWMAKRMLALLDELEAAEKRMAGLGNAICELLPGTQYMDPPDGGSVTPLEQVSRMIADYREQLQAAQKRIVELASLEAEPIYQCEFCHHDGNGELQWHWEDVNKDFYDQYDPERRGKRRIIYTAPPAPVSVPTFDEWLEIRGNKPLGWGKDAMRESYDACRAAMLQGGKS
ncbi:hypothetical protein VLI49_001636 [Enterobacter kobei]|nr:hypothetical protein [Enterobacter kobei]